MARVPDLFRAFQALDPQERDLLLRWARELEVEVEGCPPLRAVVEAVAMVRVADSLPGPVEGAFQEAALSLGMDPTAGDSVRRKVNYWRAKGSPGKNIPDIAAVKGEVSGRR